MPHFLSRLVRCLLLAPWLAGCSLLAPDEKILEAPAAPAPDWGSADFSRYVALGDGFSAGFQSGALYASAQAFSLPALLAQAMQTDCEQPLVADPGIYDPALEAGHLHVVFVAGEVEIFPIPWPAGPPAFLNAGLMAPYHNLGIPGALLVDLIQATDMGSSQAGDNAYFDIILRNAQIDWTLLGGPESDLTALQQALLLAPTFLSVWVGNSEFLGAARAGLGAPLVDLPTFRFLFADQLMAGLLSQLPEARFVLGNILPVTLLPYFTTVPWFIKNPLDAEPVDGDSGTPGVQRVGLLAADAPGGSLGSDDLVLLSVLSFDGDDADAIPDLDQGLGVPAWILIEFLIALGYENPEDALPGLFPHAGEALPGSLTLVRSEVQSLEAEIEGFNAFLAEFAGEHGIPIADVNALCEQLSARDASGAYLGMSYEGHMVSPEFVTGGFFGLDGIHPTKVGQAILAGAFIAAINAANGAQLPPARLPYFIVDY